LLDPYVHAHFLPHLDARVEAGDRLRARTASEYRKVALSRVLPVLGHRRTSELRAPDADLLARTLLAEGLAPATVKRAVHVLKLVAAFAESDDGGRVLPVGTAAYMKPRLPEAKPKRPRLTPHQADRVTALLLTEARQADPPAVVLPALLVTTLGVRRGEAIGALRSAWDSERRTLAITVSMTELPDGTLVPEAPKSENGVRVLPVPVEVAEVIDAALARRPFGTYLAEPSRAALGTPVRPSRLSSYLRSKVRQAGLPDEVSGAHAFRRAVADRLLASGTDLLLTGRLLGHANERLVADVYGGKQEARVIDLADVLALPMRKNVAS
jgi:integrase